jgi:hypothetical protein
MIKPDHSFLGHAVSAPEIAPIGDGNAEIIYRSSERINEHRLDWSYDKGFDTA